MPDRGWIWAQFALAGVVLVLSLVGVIGLVVFDAAELTFSFHGAIQAFAVFPGTVLSLVVNALVMRRHREAGLSVAEKVLLGIQFAIIAGLLVLHFLTEALGVAILVWPVHILLSIAIVVVAGVRNSTIRRAAANPYVAPPAPPAQPVA